MIFQKYMVIIMKINKNNNEFIDFEKDIAICISVLNNIRFKYKSIFPTLNSFYEYVELIINDFKSLEDLEKYVSDRIRKI